MTTHSEWERDTCQRLAAIRASLKTFEIWYRGEFKFNARSVSAAKLRATMIRYRGGWLADDIDVKDVEIKEKIDQAME